MKNRSNVLWSAAAVAAVAMWGVSRAQAAVDLSPTVNNGSFESPALAAGAEAAGAGDNWNVYNFVFTENTTGRTAPAFLAAEDGTQVIKTYGGGSGAYQDFAVTPGQTYNASAYAEFSASDPPPPTTGAADLGQLLAIFEATPGGTIIRTDADTIINSANGYTPDQYVLGSLTGTVPVGATDLRFQLATANGGVGSVFYDNANLSVGAVPEPASAGLIAAGLAALALSRRRRTA